LFVLIVQALEKFLEDANIDLGKATKDELEAVTRVLVSYCLWAGVGRLS
jgi:hypothetical protein